jgi:hypothetical protein
MIDLGLRNQCNQSRETLAHRLTNSSSALWGQTWAGVGVTWLAVVTAEGMLAPAVVMLEKHAMILGLN